MLTAFISAHWVAISFALAYLFVAAANCLPEPEDPRPASTKIYDFFYTLVHLLANKVVERRPNLAVPKKPEVTQ